MGVLGKIDNKLFAWLVSILVNEYWVNEYKDIVDYTVLLERLIGDKNALSGYKV